MFISMLDFKALRENLFIIGTTNRFDLIDPAVYRQGRLGLHMPIIAIDTADKIDILLINLEKVESILEAEYQKDRAKLAAM